jgi:hypothetical protein
MSISYLSTCGGAAAQPPSSSAAEPATASATNRPFGRRAALPDVLVLPTRKPLLSLGRLFLQDRLPVQDLHVRERQRPASLLPLASCPDELLASCCPLLPGDHSYHP